MTRKVLVVICVTASTGSSATEKVFLSAKNTCYVAAGQVWGASNNENFYSEIIGPINSVSGQLCLKSFFDTRACKPSIFYNFRLACRDGLATAPQLFMALFGKDTSTQQSGFALAGDQLSYIDPVRDFSGSNGRRVSLPPGYAPLNTSDINSFIKHLTWDDLNARPALNRNVTADQARRIQRLFVVRSGFVEPFPESNIKRALDISEEPQPQPQPPPASYASTPQVSSAPNSVNFFTPNSFSAVSSGFIFVAFISWVLGKLAKVGTGDHARFGRQVVVESLASLISTGIWVWLGYVDEWKLLTVPLGGGFAVILVSAIRSA